jgi:hypothetical protein
MGTWRRHFFRTKTSARTTWKLRIGVLALVVLVAVVTRDAWVAAIGRSLVCARTTAPSDAMLIENFDPDYLLFERAESLERAGIARWALVPVETSPDPRVPNPVSLGVAEVMARQARMKAWKVLPIRHTEPISLNAAYQIRDYLALERATSVVVIAPAFRSRRSMLVYEAVLGSAGMQVRCEPVFGLTSETEWPDTWHGIQGVVEQFVKLQYYRFYVMPFVFRGSGRAA